MDKIDEMINDLVRKVSNLGKNTFCEDDFISQMAEIDILKSALRVEYERMEKENERMKAALEWISVEERLPEDLRPVIVKGKSENPNRKGYDVCWLCNGDWTSWFVKDITHWREIE